MKRLSLSGFQLKYIALITMVFDHIHYFFDRIMSDWRGRATASARSKQQKLQKNMLEGEPHEKVSCNARSGNDGTFPCSHPRVCRRRSCIRS